MEKRYEMRFTGSGGQGVILASVIFAEAAVLSGVNAIQSQAYGPEARGGSCKAETILSKTDIWFSKVGVPQFLLAMNQKSLEEYCANVNADGLIIADDSLDIPENTGTKNIVALPIIATAKNVVGKVMTANIVAVGAINEVLGLFDLDILKEAVHMHIPAGTEALNDKALEAGTEIAAAYANKYAADIA